MNMFYYQSHSTKFFYSLSLFFLVAIFSCNKVQVITSTPYKILRIEELKGNSIIDKTTEIELCRIDDEFYFEDNQRIDIVGGDTSCFTPEGEGIENATWNITEIDGLSGDFLELDIPLSAFFYSVHDSLTLSLTSEQWLNGENQFYKIIEFGDERIIIQNADGVSEPKTENIWQLTLEKEQ